MGLGFKKHEIRLKEIVQAHPNMVKYFAALNQTELNLIYNQSKWFFFPSRNEPFGLVASESIFSGTPVITTQTGGLREQVTENVNGFIMNNVEDENAIMQLINEVHNMSSEAYNNLSKNCNAHNSRFSLQYVCNRLIKIYNSI